jgi:hypothetical protein
MKTRGAWRARLRLLIFTLCFLNAPLGEAAQLTLTWTDNAAGQAWFVIERAQGTGGTFIQLGETAVGAVEYIDTMIATGTTYCYRVAAVNDTSQSVYSNVSCGIVPIPPPVAVPLTVGKSGTGTGTVTSSPNGIACGTQCMAQYASGTIVLLTATPHPSARFTGWSGGGCSGASLCRVTLTAPVTVTATFTKGKK